NAADIAYWRQQVEQDFIAFSRYRRIYYQVRYITEHGKEFIRIDSDGARVYAIPEHALQDKSGRYYFQEAMRLRTGEVFVSPLDLNREHGQIERPFKPVIRYATPLFDRQGHRRGIVITNIFADRFLAEIRQGSHAQPRLMLVDQDGYYLAHPDPRQEWGGPRDLNTGINLRDDYPDVWPEILSGQAGSIVNQRAIVYYPIFPAPDNPDYYWVLVHDEPRQTIFASVWSFRVTAASILTLAAVAATIMAGALSRSLTAPVRALQEGVERFGRGELSEPVSVQSRDEIGQLAEAFNTMAADLHRSQTQRQQLLERLISAQEEERRMVAYDIHDGLIQRLVGARLQLTNFVGLRAKDPDQAEQALQRALQHLSVAIVEGRHLVEGLRPALLDDLGLVPALHELAQQVAAEMGCELEFLSNLTDERLPAPVEITVFRIAQEALSNSQKHSRTARLRLELSRQNGWLELVVQDWGGGFDMEEGRNNRRCVGLVGMRERASLIGGTCDIISRPGRGVLVKSRIPLEW
ncbi:MAG: HAMP domain-containing protein, partial [Chloroflexi bacterium]